MNMDFHLFWRQCTCHTTTTTSTYHCALCALLQRGSHVRLLFPNIHKNHSLACTRTTRTLRTPPSTPPPHRATAHYARTAVPRATPASPLSTPSSPAAFCCTSAAVAAADTVPFSSCHCPIYSRTTCHLMPPLHCSTTHHTPHTSCLLHAFLPASPPPHLTVPWKELISGSFVRTVHAAVNSTHCHLHRLCLFSRPSSCHHCHGL